MQIMNLAGKKSYSFLKANHQTNSAQITFHNEHPEEDVIFAGAAASHLPHLQLAHHLQGHHLHPLQGHQ